MWVDSYYQKFSGIEQAQLSICTYLDKGNIH